MILEYLKKGVNKPISESISPSSLWLKGFLINVEHGVADIEYTIRQEMTNPFGTLQGGVMAALIDDTMGMAFLTLSQKYLFTTTNLNINYLFGAKEGEKVVVKARVLRLGKKVANIECKVINMDGDIICTATSNLVVTSTITKATMAK